VEHGAEIALGLGNEVEIDQKGNDEAFARGGLEPSLDLAKVEPEGRSPASSEGSAKMTGVAWATAAERLQRTFEAAAVAAGARIAEDMREVSRLHWANYFLGSTYEDYQVPGRSSPTWKRRAPSPAEAGQRLLPLVSLEAG